MWMVLQKGYMKVDLTALQKEMMMVKLTVETLVGHWDHQTVSSKVWMKVGRRDNWKAHH